MKRRVFISMLLIISIILSFCYIDFTKYRAEVDVWSNTEDYITDERGPIVTKSMDRYYYCKVCGCNFIDVLSLECYKEKGYYLVRGGGKEASDYEQASTTKGKNGYVYNAGNLSCVQFNHRCPRRTVYAGKTYNIGDWCPDGGGSITVQPYDDLGIHTEPEIAKIVPQIQITCTYDNWDGTVQGETLGLKYTGKEQHPIVRVVSDGKVLSSDTYSLYYLNSENLNYQNVGNYSAVNPSHSSDKSIDAGEYYVVVRFNEKSIFRGSDYVGYEIIGSNPTSEDPATETTTSSQNNDEKKQNPVENKSATETEVKTKTKVEKGDVLKSSKALYTLTSDTTLSFDKPIKKTETVKVPDSIKVNNKTYKVTTVSQKAFNKNTKVKTVSIGKNVKTIDKYAFRNCTNLKTVKFKGKNIKKIGTGAFKGCTNLKSVSIPGTALKTIGASSFYGCKKLKTVVIKSKKVTFGKNSFKGIYKKATFKVPKSKIKAYKKSLVKSGKAASKIKVKKY